MCESTSTGLSAVLETNTFRVFVVCMLVFIAGLISAMVERKRARR